MSQFFKTREEIESWLRKMGIAGYTIKEDLTVDVRGIATLSWKNLKALPVRFGRVDGDFYCNNNQLSSLAGAPVSVGCGFYCSDNLLTTLEWSPSFVGGNFSCSHNPLNSLDGAPLSVGLGFYCQTTNLITLAGAPKTTGGEFFCTGNSISTLDGAPSLVFGNFISDFSPADLRSQIKAIFARGGEFFAENLAGLCAEIRAEMAAEAMSSAIGGAADVPAIARRKADRA